MAQNRPATKTRKAPAGARARKKAAEKVNWNFPLRRENFVWLGIGLGVILLGYILLSLGITEDAATIEGTWNNSMSVTVAPILLVIGYCVLIPYAILKGLKALKSNAADNANEDSTASPAETQASH